MPKFRKQTVIPANRVSTTMTIEPETETPETLEPEELQPEATSKTPTEAPTSSGELFNLETESLLKAAKARQQAALSSLETEMESMVETFTDRAVAIVEKGFQDCFFRASQRIRDLQLNWTTTNGNELGELQSQTVDTIALPSGASEPCETL